MSASPLLAALLRRALPGLRALEFDLSAPALFPWLPCTLCGLPDAASMPPAEAALLDRFRHPDGRRLVGFDRAADAALLAGAPASWEDAPERLIRPAAAPPRALPADALVLARPGAEDTYGVPRARILLLLGAGRTVQRHDLLVPAPRLEAIHAAVRGAAEFLAGTSGGRWMARAVGIAPDMASIALLPEDAQVYRPSLSIPAEALVHDLPARAGPDGLDLSDAGRVRLLLGIRPRRLRAFLRGDASGAALFGDGQRLSATAMRTEVGETCLESKSWRPCAGAAILGIAVPAPARVALARLELLP